MNMSGDAAESIIRMSLQGLEVTTKITGAGAKNVATLLYAILKDQQQIKGKTTLTKMIKSGKSSKVFSIREVDLKRFSEESKRYGVLFCALVKKGMKSQDGLIDIMVREEDASKVNRIIKRFNLIACEESSIENTIQHGKFDKTKGIEVKSIESKLIDDISEKPIKKENNEIINPNVAKTEKSPQSEPLLMNKEKSEGVSKTLDKPSVKEKLVEIKKELNNKVSNNSDKKIKHKSKGKKNGGKIHERT